MNDFSDLVALFRFTLSPLEIIMRGTAVYWFLFALFRFVMRRDVGSIGIADMLLLMMISDAVQNAMAGEYKSVSDGCLLVATIAGWNYLLDWSSFHFPLVRRFAEAKPLALIRNGRLMRANMRRELVTVDELMGKIREEGVDHLGEVREAFLENDGQISVVLKASQGKKADSPDKPESDTKEDTGTDDLEPPNSVVEKRPRHSDRKRPIS